MIVGSVGLIFQPRADLVSYQEDTPEADKKVCREFWKGQLIQV
jgi:hypothetical protein